MGFIWGSPYTLVCSGRENVVFDEFQSMLMPATRKSICCYLKEMVLHISGKRVFVLPSKGECFIKVNFQPCLFESKEILIGDGGLLDFYQSFHIGFQIESCTSLGYLWPRSY